MQATEEQLRVAKLSQLNSKEDIHIQEKIKEVILKTNNILM